jgi:hypothetical protein
MQGLSLGPFNSSVTRRTAGAMEALSGRGSSSSKRAAQPGVTEVHTGAVEAQPGDVKPPQGAMDVQPGALEASTEDVLYDNFLNFVPP